MSGKWLLSAGLVVGLYACAVGGGDGDSDDIMDEVVGDAGIDSGLPPSDGGFPQLDSGGNFGGGYDASTPVDASTPRDSSTPVDSGGSTGGSTAGGDDAGFLAGLGGLLGGFGGLIGGADSGVP